MEKELLTNVELKWDYIPADEGGSHESGHSETIPHRVEITSVKIPHPENIDDGIEIIKYVDIDQLQEWASEILETEYES